METMKFNEIPIFDWGNNLTMTGVVFTDRDENSVIVEIPQKESGELKSIIKPTVDEWKKLLHQTDYLETEGKLDDNTKIILRKGQRMIDGNISWKVFRRDKYKCRYCGINHVPLTVDHIILWEERGSTTEDNLLTACRKCNKKRGNMQYQDWIQSEYVKKKHQYLTEQEIQANEEIVNRLDKIERVLIIRTR